MYTPQAVRLLNYIWPGANVRIALVQQACSVGFHHLYLRRSPTHDRCFRSAANATLMLFHKVLACNTLIAQALTDTTLVVTREDVFHTSARAGIEAGSSATVITNDGFLSSGPTRLLSTASVALELQEEDVISNDVFSAHTNVVSERLDASLSL